MAFLGTIGYYRRFNKGFSIYSSLLTPAARAKAASKVQWSREMQEAIKSLHMCYNILLSDDVYELHTDASGLGVAYVLNVCRSGEALPVVF